MGRTPLGHALKSAKSFAEPRALPPVSPVIPLWGRLGGGENWVEFLICDELRKGRSQVIEKNHTVILGWTPQVFAILHELSIANQSQKDSCVVILGNEDKVTMEDEVRERLGHAQKSSKDFAVTLRGTRSTSSPTPVQPCHPPVRKARGG